MDGLFHLASLLFLIQSCIAVGGNEQNCQLLKPKLSEISVTSRRNQTGHWISQVSLARTISSQDNGDRSDRNMQFNIQHGEKSCGGQETIFWITTVTDPPPLVGPDYEFHPGVGRYKLHTAPQTWANAVSTCAKEGAHLAVVNSEKESEVLKNMLEKHPTKTLKTTNNDFVFLGFHDMYKEGTYVTIFGDSLASTGFTRWAGPGQPDNAGNNENCGSLHRNGGLNDIPCSMTLAFFCEQELW